MADYTSTTLMKDAQGANAQPSQMSNIAELSDGTLVYVVSPSGTNYGYLQVYRSYDNGANNSLFCRMRHSSWSFYTNLLISAQGMKLAITGTWTWQTSTFLTGLDFSVVSQGATVDNLEAGASGMWAFRTLGSSMDGCRPYSILFASDNNVYVSWFFWRNYSGSDNDEYYSYLQSAPYGSAGDNFKTDLTGGTPAMYSGQVFARTIVEYQGYVLFFLHGGNSAVYTVPLGGTSLIGRSTTGIPYPMFAAFPHTDGYLYAVSYNGTNQFVVHKTNSAPTGTMSFTQVKAPTAIGNAGTIAGAQLGRDGNIYIFYFYNNVTTTGGLWLVLVNTAGALVLGDTQLINNGTGVPMLNGDTQRSLYNRFVSNPSTQKTVAAFATYQNTSYPYVYTWSRSFNTAPNAPTISNGKWLGAWFNVNPTYTWTFNDPDAGDSQSAWQLQRSKDNWATVDYDTGKVAGGAKSHAMGWSNVGQNWVRIKTWDSSDVQSDWAWEQYGYDVVAPTVSAVNVGAVYSNQASGTTKNVSVDISDATSGAIMYDAYYSNNNGASWTQCIGQVTGSGATKTFAVPITVEHTYLVDFYVRDNAGNNAANWPVRGAFIIDRTAPAAPTQTNGVLYATSNGVSWSAFSDGPAGLTSGLLLTTLYLQIWNGTTWVTATGYPKSVTGLSYSFTGLTPGTQYRWGLTYTDNAGNVSTLNYTTFTTNTYAVSTINNLASSGSILNQRPKIRFTPTDANDATLTDFQIQISSSNTFTTNIVDSTRSAKPGEWSTAAGVPSGTAIAYSPVIDLGTGTKYVRARSHDGKEWGTWSTTTAFTIQAVTYPTTLAADDTAVSKRTIDDLRTKTNAVRQARGLAVVVWTDAVIKDWNDPAATDVKATHIIELRQAIKDIYTALFVTAPTWPTDPIIDSTKDRKGQHWIELRNAIIAA
ncbi:hypothetical protein [Bacillus sp. 3255]|uniref:hypothetical protein n=1 Tax=Bacillus sp. 3255 TaxID=2817904 RepID=UPI002865FBEF|nr:hypothetical protein [Bacillus sp. 3255]MDR6883804.1 hypothetical protein [Bacillus sp. 3255]